MLTTKNRIPRNVSFGIEIEFLLPEKKTYETREQVLWRIQQALAKKGVQLSPATKLVDGLGKETYAHWGHKLDMSIVEIRQPVFHHPIEICSPILNGEKGLAELKVVLETLAELGAVCNSSCGYHIHVSRSHRPFIFREIKNFAAAVLKNRMAYEEMISPNRRTQSDNFRAFSSSTITRDRILSNVAQLHEIQGNDKHARINLKNANPLTIQIPSIFGRTFTISDAWKTNRFLVLGVYNASRILPMFRNYFFPDKPGKNTMEFRGKEGVNFGDIMPHLKHTAHILRFADRAFRSADADITAVNGTLPRRFRSRPQTKSSLALH